MPQMSSPPIHEHHTGRIIGIVLAILFLFGAGGVGAYMYYTSIPENIIAQSLIAMEDVDTVRFNTQINVHVEPIEKEDAVASPESVDPFALDASSLFAIEPQDIAIELAGGIDVSEEAYANADLVLDVVSSKAGSQNRTAVQMQLKANEQVYFVRIGDLPPMGFFDLSFLTHKWISLDLSENASKDSIGELVGGLNDSLDSYLEEDTAAMAERKQKAEAMKARSEALLLERPIFVVTKKHRPEKVNGVLAHHLSYELDTTALTYIVTTLDQEFGEEDTASVKESLEKLEEIDHFFGDMWIGKKDGLLYQLTGDLLFHDETAVVTADIAMKFSDFNQPVIVISPSESTSIEDLFVEVMGTMLGGFGADTFGDDTTDTDGDGLTDTHEFWLGLDSEDPDSDGDGIGDSEDPEYTDGEYSFAVDLTLDPSTLGLPTGDSDMGVFDLGLPVGGVEADGMLNAEIDTDGDGLTDAVERVLGSDVNNPDSDGDGFTDGEEVENGYSPVG